MHITGYINAIPVMIKRQCEADNYRVYVTDALKAITNNTTNYIIPGHGAVAYGTMFERRFADIISGKQQEPVETAEDVIDRITNKLTRGKDGRS